MCSPASVHAGKTSGRSHMPRIRTEVAGSLGLYPGLHVHREVWTIGKNSTLNPENKKKTREKERGNK